MRLGLQLCCTTLGFQRPLYVNAQRNFKKLWAVQQVVANICNLRLWEAEAGESKV
jgi:hypothetical protein